MKKNINLVELNLRDSSAGVKRVSITTKEDKNKGLKTLSSNEINQIKKKIKEKSNKEKYASKKIIVKKKVNNVKIKEKKINYKKKELPTNNVNKKVIDVDDICIILEKCSIEEISKYLLKNGKNKNFPDITKRRLN